jgi:hypothetical protein
MSVYKIVVTTTKQENDPWIRLDKDNILTYFSAQEVREVFVPYFRYADSMPGYLPQQSAWVTEGNTQKSIISFDSNENMLAAKNNLFGDSVSEVVVAKNNLRLSKQQELGVQYTTTITTEIEE